MSLASGLGSSLSSSLGGGLGASAGVSLGPELWDASQAVTIADGGGSTGAWDGVDTISSGTTGGNSYPRVRFNSIGVTSGKTYQASFTVDDPSLVNYVTMGNNSGPRLTINGNTITGTLTANANELRFTMDSTGGAFSMDITAASVREVL